MTVRHSQPQSPPFKAIFAQWPAPAVATSDKNHYEGPEIYFNDKPLSEEVVVHQNPLQQIGHGVKQVFVELPKAVWRGLQGTPEYTFGDFLLIGKVPYYLGGATLAAIFAMGRHGLTLARQGPAIAMYYLAIGLSNMLINQSVKSNTGLDLGLKYKNALGKLKPVYGDATFSRYDLVPKATYQHMAKKMGIPLSVADPDDEVQSVIADMLPRIRLAKMVLGNTLAAVAAGYLARTDEWHRVFTTIPGVLWHKKPAKRLGILLKDSAKVIAHQFGGVKRAAGMGLPPKQFAVVKHVAMGFIAAAVITTWRLLRPPVDNKAYQHSERIGDVKPPLAQHSGNLSRAQLLWETDQQREFARHGRDVATLQQSRYRAAGGTQ